MGPATGGKIARLGNLRKMNAMQTGHTGIDINPQFCELSAPLSPCFEP